MKNYIKYISLGTATLMLSGWMQAGNCMSMGKIIELSDEDQAQAERIKNDLTNEFEQLKNKSDNWVKDAEKFIRIFDEFNNFLIAVADVNGCVPPENSLIDTSLWHEEHVINYINYRIFLKKEVVDEIYKKAGNDSYKRLVGFQKYFEKDKEKYLKKVICKSLGVDNLSAAATYWEEKFIKPVGQLLVEHSQEMIKGDAETLQLLLNLHRCYRGCELIPSEKPYWDNFENVNNKFYNSLAKTILKSEDSGEKRNILFTVLRKEDVLEIQEKEYLGYSKYNLQIEVLVKRINDIRDAESITPSEDMGKSIAYAQQVADRVVAEKQAEDQGKALRRGALSHR